MRQTGIVVAIVSGALLAPSATDAKTLCSLLVDAADGRAIVREGDCGTRVTPASTFKIPLALMGFDSGVLADAHSPVRPFQAGFPDWGGVSWRQPTDPTRWLTYSVVWYSQFVTHALGSSRVTDYLRSFGFGNADLSGDPGRDNGLDRAWIASSLQVSPDEQAEFLRRLVARALPVSDHAYAETDRVVEATAGPDGWELHGKTGTAYPRDNAGTPDEARGYGWYVGWAIERDRRFIFVRLDQDTTRDPVATGLRTKAALLQHWTILADR